MAGIDIYPTQQAIKAAVIAEIPWEVVSGGVPTADEIAGRRVEGILNPYVVLRFADIMPAARGKSVMGPLYDEYYSYVDALCVGQTDDEARELASLVNAKLLGRVFPNTTALSRNFGAACMPSSPVIACRKPLSPSQVSVSTRTLMRLAQLNTDNHLMLNWNGYV
jgi:hypothetical protein